MSARGSMKESPDLCKPVPSLANVIEEDEAESTAFFLFSDLLCVISAQDHLAEFHVSLYVWLQREETSTAAVVGFGFSDEYRPLAPYQEALLLFSGFRCKLVPRALQIFPHLSNVLCNLFV